MVTPWRLVLGRYVEDVDGDAESLGLLDVVSDGDVDALSVGELVALPVPALPVSALPDVVSDGDDDGEVVGLPTGVMSLRST